MVTIATPIKLRSIPVRIISDIFNLLVPKTTAFGGVATGSINASDAAKVAGSINNKGFNSILIAIPASIGKSISVVAVLDVSSVKNDINRATIKIIAKG